MSRLWPNVLLVLGLALFSGCGGGTTGTDGGSEIRFAGKVLRSNGQPVAAAVTVLESGDSTRTDPTGQFLLITNSASGSATLLIEGEKVSSRVTVDGVPDRPAQILLDIRVDEGDAVVTVLGITEIGSAAPTPGPHPPGTPQQGPGSTPPQLSQSILEGRLVDPAGNPIGGAAITLPASNGSARSNSNGFFRIAFPAGAPMLRITVTASGKRASVRIGGLPEQAVKLVLVLEFEPAREPGTVGSAGLGEARLTVRNKTITRE